MSATNGSASTAAGTLGSLLILRGCTEDVGITDPPQNVDMKWGLRRFSLPLELAGPRCGPGTLLRLRTGVDCLEDVWLRFTLRQATSDENRIPPKQIRLADNVESDLLDCLLSDPQLQESMSAVLTGRMTKSFLGKTTLDMCTASKKAALSAAENIAEPTESVDVTIAYGDLLSIG